MLYALNDKSPTLLGNNFVAPNAAVIGDVLMHANASVWFGVTIRGDNHRITLGENVNVQDNAVLHTDAGLPLTLERDVSIGHMAMVHGCHVGEGTLIGIKAVVLNRAVIGRDCLIGANALIAEDKVIPDRSLVLGSPGRVVRQLTDEEVAKIRWIAAHYVENAQNYLAGLKPIDQSAAPHQA